MKLLLTTLALLLACCVPPVPPPSPDVPAIPEDAAAEAPPPDPAVDASASDCGRACANLAAHGCEEMGQMCLSTCEHLVVTGLTPFSPECVVAAKSLEALRLCPSVRCRQGH